MPAVPILAKHKLHEVARGRGVAVEDVFVVAEAELVDPNLYDADEERVSDKAGNI